MIASCRRYLTKDDTLTAWGQEKKVMLDKLNVNTIIIYCFHIPKNNAKLFVHK
jgi:hypothetical protein